MTKEYPVTERPSRAPTHPGVIMRDDVLPELHLSVSEAARQLGVTRQTLHRVMAGTTAVTPVMAVRLGKFCGNGPRLWLAMQQAYDLWHAERRLHDAVEKIPTHRAAK
jgi:addiction module HigA family antidote